MKLKTRELAIFAMLGAIMYLSKIIMEWIPNVHLLGTLTMAYTLVYRRKALYPIYVYVLLNGVLAGFGTWWIPYLYIWTILWAVTMILPKNIPTKVAPIVYMIVCALHGFGFGILYALGQAILYGFTFEQTLAWIASGFYFDVIHGFGNFFCGMLIVPIVSALKMLERNANQE